MQSVLAIAACSMLASFAATQSSIDPSAKYSWQENCGWMNWRDAHDGTGGVRANPAFLSGFIWCENVGWINVGRGPSNGSRYGNVDGSDFGANVAADGTLYGFAWSENAGWINMQGGALASPERPARFDLGALRFRGFVWCENLGWVNLDDSFWFVGTTCPSDVDDGTGSGTPDGGVTIDDLLYYLFIFEAGDIRADVDDGSSTGTPDGGVTIDDLLYYLQRFEAGC